MLYSFSHVSDLQGRSITSRSGSPSLPGGQCGATVLTAGRRHEEGIASTANCLLKSQGKPSGQSFPTKLVLPIPAPSSWPTLADATNLSQTWSDPGRLPLTNGIAAVAGGKLKAHAVHENQR